MQTTTMGSRQTHWLAGIVAVVVTLGSFAAQLTLAEHYALSAVGMQDTALAGRKAPVAIAQAPQNSALLRTALQQPAGKAALERMPAS